MISPPYRCLAALVLAGLMLPAEAQAPAVGDPGPLPAWVVPVLRLVSATHVEPTTGIVLSGGRVLVPLGFAADTDEIVVLDGGTDIVRNGRPARTDREFPELGLKVLAVQGLTRPAAPLSATPPGDGAVIVLAAYPPAERIERGEPPLRRETTLLAGGGSGAADPAPAEALPNVTGALLDACGNLVAYSLADGVQDMAPSPGTQYRWQGALQRVRQALGLAGPTAVCEDAPAANDAEAGQEDAPSGTAAQPDSAEPGPEPETQPPEEEPLAEQRPTPEAETEPPPQTEPGPDASGEDGRSTAWWLTGALLVLGGGLALRRFRKARASAPPRGPSAEPMTAPRAPKPRGEGTPAAPADSRLVLRGQFADGRPLELSVAVNAAAIDVEIGRGAGADLVIDSPAVSRRHARFGCAGGLTFGDLGSANGSSINGVPCLEGEVMYLESGDTVILGDVRFTVELLPDPEGRDNE